MRKMHETSRKKNPWIYHKTPKLGPNISTNTGFKNKQQLACTVDALFNVCICGEFKRIALRWRSSFAEASECSCACNIGTGHLRQRSSFAGFTGCLRVMASILNYPFIYLLLASSSMLEKDPMFWRKKFNCIFDIDCNAIDLSLRGWLLTPWRGGINLFWGHPSTVVVRMM